MPRYMSDDAEYLYRVVVKTTWSATDERPERSLVQHYGSYNTRQAANAQATRHKSEDNWYTYRDRTRITEATVQRTSVKWEDVSD